MGNVTGDQVREAMKAANITHVDHHDCGGCGYMTRYLREGDALLFDSGCYCGSRGVENLQSREWQSAADWINMQNDEWKATLMERFGLTPNPKRSTGGALSAPSE